MVIRSPSRSRQPGYLEGGISASRMFIPDVDHPIASRKDLTAALQRAVAYLNATQESDGAFHAYASKSIGMQNAVKYASPFITPFVLQSVRDLQYSGLAGLRSKGLQFLCREQEAGGIWRTHTLNNPFHDEEALPADLDDIAVISHCLSVHGACFDDNKSLIMENTDNQGLFLTWVDPPFSNEIDGVVQANVLAYLGSSYAPACRFITDLVVYDRPFSQWYPDPFAFYYAISRAICNGVEGLVGCRPHLLKRIYEQTKSDGSFGTPLQTAFALNTLLDLHGEERRIAQGLAVLISQQRKDGAWPIETFYRGFANYYGSPALTTAIAVEAIKKAEARSITAILSPLASSSDSRLEVIEDGRHSQISLCLSNWLESYMQPLPDRFIPASNKDYIQRVAGMLPLLSGGGLECHLGTSKRRTDLILRVMDTDGGQEALAGLHPVLTFSPELYAHGTWQRIKAFSHQWSTPGTLLHETVRTMWLEFDATATVASHPVPSVFFDVNGVSYSNLEGYTQRINHGIRYLTDTDLSSTVSKALQRVLVYLPNHAHLYYLGAMLSRPTRALRVCLGGLRADEILPYLQVLGYQSTIERLNMCLNTYGQEAERFVLNLDVGPDASEKIGLEVFLPGHAPNNAWQHLFDLLVQHDLCTEEEHTAILGWEGYTAIDPQDPTYHALRAATHGDLRVMIRRLNHLKFVIEEDEPSVRAKAYLFMGYD